MVKYAILFLIFLLAGCGTADTETTPTPAAATEPAQPTAAATPTPEPTPDPLVQGSGGLPWWNDTVFYEVFVRSFYDSDGDGVGDLNGLIERLDYLNDGDPTTTDDLGVTGIWLMPVMESPSYHGYDVVDYYTIDQEYGTNEDFQRLMVEAHARGIRVIVDLVLNHTGIDHPWFQDSRQPDSPMRDWYIWAEENPGFRGPWGQQVWHNTPTGFYYGVFWSGMPDLNFQNPAVSDAMLEATRFWLEEMGADGFRLDAIKHLFENGQLQENTAATHEWLQTFYTFYKDVSPQAFAVGEAWTSTQQVLKYTGSEVDVAFQFDLAEAVINGVNNGFANQVGRLQSQIVNDFPSGQYATFLTNHDQNRIMSQLGEEEARAFVAATWLLTSPGVPFIYYGEEIGMIGTKPDEDIRRPLQWHSDSYRVGFTEGRPWRAPASDYPERSVALQEEDAASLLNHYRALIHLRNAHESLRTGDWLLVETGSIHLYAYLRYTEGEIILVLINLDDEAVSDHTLSLESGPLTGEITGTQTLYGEQEFPAPTLNENGGFANYQPLPTIPPYSSYVIQLLP